MTVSISPAAMEKAEAETYADFEDAAPPATLAALGTVQLRIGGGTVLAMANDPSGFWSKTVGLGFDEPVSAALLRRVFEFYQEHGVSAATVQIAPEAMPVDWADICAELNISGPASSWVKLAGDMDIVAESSQAAARLDAGLRVERVPPSRAREWAEVMWTVFGLPGGPQLDMAIASVGRQGWHSFAVVDGKAIVATAALHVVSEIGHLFGAATLPEARGRGAQSALIAARAIAAREAQCALLMGETGAEGPGEHNFSLHNMLRAGLSVRYNRQNWKWTSS
jgi:GNAT superfamily N-acetyltransferase